MSSRLSRGHECVGAAFGGQHGYEIIGDLRHVYFDSLGRKALYSAFAAQDVGGLHVHAAGVIVEHVEARCAVKERQHRLRGRDERSGCGEFRAQRESRERADGYCQKWQKFRIHNASLFFAACGFGGFGALLWLGRGAAFLAEVVEGGLFGGVGS